MPLRGKEAGKANIKLAAVLVTPKSCVAGIFGDSITHESNSEEARQGFQGLQLLTVNVRAWGGHGGGKWFMPTSVPIYRLCVVAFCAWVLLLRVTEISASEGQVVQGCILIWLKLGDFSEDSIATLVENVENRTWRVQSLPAGWGHAGKRPAPHWAPFLACGQGSLLLILDKS